MSIVHLLPEIAVRNSGKSKRKRQEIPSLSNRGRKGMFPAHVVNGCLWLMEHGWSFHDCADLIGAKSITQPYRWRTGEDRPHAKPEQPDAAFWDWVRARGNTDKELGLR